MPHTVPGGVPYDMPKFSAMLPTSDTTGDFEEMCMPAGDGVCEIKSIMTAGQIVMELMAQAAALSNHQSAIRG